MDSPQQLSLGVSLDDDARFSNFFCFPGSPNAQTLKALMSQLSSEGEPFIFLWGGSGLTHLLQAACHSASADGLSVQYLPLMEVQSFDPDSLFEGLEEMDLVCIDDVQVIAGKPAWETALFALFNQLRDRGVGLLMAAKASPKTLPLDLPDLQSRLNWGLTLQVQALSDDEKLQALQFRARARGLELSDEVGHFILHRAPREMHELFASLNQLDQASLAEQRRLTIPFVKQVLKF
jgi:DnaA family protein